MSRYSQKSLASGLPSAIAVTLGVAIVATGLFASVSTYAQNGTPGTTKTPSPTDSPVTIPGTETIKTTPGDTMTKPAQGTPGGTMTKPETTVPGAVMKKPATASRTIVDIAGKSKSFTTLVTALKAADLVETLAGEGPYTVFAPTNAAFAKLPKATLAKLLKPQNKEQLKRLLTYHVVSGAVTSKTLKAGKVETVEGSSITVKIKGKKVMVNNANVILADVKASNGVIHAIDTVMMPPAAPAK
jgi:uncharacterized surface protein with fasciclin (FAS1) repeats